MGMFVSGNSTASAVSSLCQLKLSKLLFVVWKEKLVEHLGDFFYLRCLSRSCCWTGSHTHSSQKSRDVF